MPNRLANNENPILLQALEAQIQRIIETIGFDLSLSMDYAQVNCECLHLIHINRHGRSMVRVFRSQRVLKL